jgi:hypothetical protein
MCPLFLLTISGPNARQVNLFFSMITAGLERRGLPVTGQVDLDQLLDSLRWEFEDWIVGSYSSVVDEDTGSAELFSDFVCGSVNCVRVGNVAFDIMGDHYLSVSCLIGTASVDIKRKVEPTHLTQVALVMARHPGSPP